MSRAQYGVSIVAGTALAMLLFVFENGLQWRDGPFNNATWVRSVAQDEAGAGTGRDSGREGDDAPMGIEALFSDDVETASYQHAFDSSAPYLSVRELMSYHARGFLRGYPLPQPPVGERSSNETAARGSPLANPFLEKPAGSAATGAVTAGRQRQQTRPPEVIARVNSGFPHSTTTGEDIE